MIEVCYDILDSISSMIECGRNQAISDIQGHKRSDLFITILVQSYAKKVEQLYKIFTEPKSIDHDDQYNHRQLLCEEISKISHVIVVLLNNDGMQMIFVDKGMIKSLDSALKHFLQIPQTVERNDLLLSLVIMIANLFSDYSSSDMICDRMIKESSILKILFEDLTFYSDTALVKHLSKDLACIITNLSETDDLWCVN